MKRKDLAISITKFSMGNIIRSLKLLFSFALPSFEQRLARNLGDILDASLENFDESSSNYVIGKTNTHDQRNILMEQLSRSAAEAYGANFARISLGGSSKSIRQVIGHIIPRARPRRSIIFLDPACHKSVFAGLIESGLDVVFLRREFSQKYGITGPLDFKHFRRCLLQHRTKLAAVLITRPTYEGFCDDLEEIAFHCEQHSALLCIDAAWGSNFGLVEGLPPMPVKQADIVITSPHKKGAAPSQIGLILFRSKELTSYYDAADRAGCETTSPNWPLLLVFEHRLAVIKQGTWRAAWQTALAASYTLRSELSRTTKDLAVVTPSELGFSSHDPTHLFVSCNSSGVSGRQIAGKLSEDFQIDVELSSLSGFLLLIGPQHLSRIKQAAADISAAYAAAPREGDLLVRQTPNVTAGSLSKPFNPRKAYFSETESLPIQECLGRTSASLVYAYPPGIPLLSYGQVITRSHIEVITMSERGGVTLSGIGEGNRISVSQTVGLNEAICISLNTETFG